MGRWTKSLMIILAVYWVWHALVVFTATGSLDPLGYSMGGFYLENLLSLYFPPVAIAFLHWRHRKRVASR